MLISIEPLNIKRVEPRHYETPAYSSGERFRDREGWADDDLDNRGASMERSESATENRNKYQERFASSPETRAV